MVFNCLRSRGDGVLLASAAEDTSCPSDRRGGSHRNTNKRQ